MSDSQSNKKIKLPKMVVGKYASCASLVSQQI